MLPECNLYKYRDIHACIQIKGGIITTGFVEIVPVTFRPSLSSFLRIIRALTFFIVVNHMNMNETSVETCRMASVLWSAYETRSFATLYQECYPATFVDRHSTPVGLRVPYCAVTCVPLWNTCLDISCLMERALYRVTHGKLTSLK